MNASRSTTHGAITDPAPIVSLAGSDSWRRRLVVLAGLLPTLAFAQAPGVVWSTNLGATLFAVDAQTNAHANVGGKVIAISSAGLPLQTNTICPLPGVARRDDAGNLYFGGSFDGTQDFGGITIVGGWTNWPSPGHWTPGYPTCFLAKYASNGSLQWVKSFGAQAEQNNLTGLALDSSGSCYAGYVRAGRGATASFDAAGALLADQIFEQTLGASLAVKLGGTTSSNCAFFLFRYADHELAGRVNRTGGFSWAGVYPLRWRSLESQNATPVIDDLAQIFQVGRCFDPILDPDCGAQVMRKCGVAGPELWSLPVTTEAHWTLARDAQANVYVAGTNGMFAKYDTDGNLIWSNNFSRQAVSMVVDAAGNRFLSFADGGVARLAAEAAAIAPTILSNPQPVTVFVGDPVTLAVVADGTAPLRYAWRLDGANVGGATNASYTFSNAAPAQAGNYTVVVTNIAGATTSSPPALVRVKSVQFYLGSQMLTNGSYLFTSAPTLSIRSAFVGGSSFYTLDGSPPTFASTYYSGPFLVGQSATVRALGYNANFTQSEEADALNIVVLANHTLTASASGGGSVSLNPPGGSYVSTNVVTATAQPAPGWTFLCWLGDVAGNNPAANISMEHDKTIRAVFGTTLATAVAGSGQIQLAPPAGVYAYGSVVRLTGIPDPGNYFGFWGNAATGNTNPLYFAVTAPTQTVSCIFGATPDGQAALTLMITGSGRLTASPPANAYTLNDSVILTATPDTGQSFLGWSGDASGSQNPLPFTINVAKVVTANFTARPELQVDRPGLDGWLPVGFRFTLTGDPPATFQIFGSTNLTNWDWLGWLTNSFGEAQFTDPTATEAARKFYRAAP